MKYHLTALIRQFPNLKTRVAFEVRWNCNKTQQLWEGQESVLAGRCGHTYVLEDTIDEVDGEALKERIYFFRCNEKPGKFKTKYKEDQPVLQLLEPEHEAMYEPMEPAAPSKPPKLKGGLVAMGKRPGRPAASSKDEY